MQPKHFLLVFLLPALIMSCNPTIPTGIVSYVSYSSNTLKVNSEGYGQTEVEIEDNAAVNAIQRLLFEGIAGSSFAEPIITDSGKKNSSYFKEMEQSGYRRYITAIRRSTPVTQHKGLVRTASFEVTIDVASLRRSLEQAGVIRKFGF